MSSATNAKLKQMVQPQQQHRPWQLDWKRPRWTPLHQAADEHRDKQDLIVIDHAAAHVAHAEVRELILRNEKHHAIDDDLISSQDVCFVVTVTSVAPQIKVAASTTTRVADRLLVELHATPATCADQREHGSNDDDDNESATTTRCLLQRTLYWPEQTWKRSSGEAAAGQKIMPLPSWLHTRKTQLPPSTYQQSGAAAAGILQATLCRAPPSNAAAQVAHAVDVVNFMSLHGGAAAAPPAYSAAAQSTMSQTTERPVLLLACLSSRGKLYYYNVLQLLANTDRPGDDDLDAGMASFLFGASMLQHVQTSMLPLSRPLAKAALPLHLHRDYATHAAAAKLDEDDDDDDEELHHDTHHETAALGGVEDNIDNDDDDHASMDMEGTTLPSFTSSVSLWEAAWWDQSVDAATLAYQTSNNRPHLVVAAGEFLCVAGTGQQRRRRPSQNRRPRFGRKMRRSGSSDSTLSEYDSRHGGQSLDTTTASRSAATSITQGSAASTTTARRRHQRRRQRRGGFVCLFSLHTKAHVRTLYLPMAPRRMAPMMWNGWCFLLIVGTAPSSAGRAEHVCAVRLDGGPVTRVARGRAPSALADPDVMDLMGADDDDKAVISIARFAIVPVILPMAQHGAISTLHVSNATIDPPCLVEATTRETSLQLSLLNFINVDTRSSQNPDIILWKNYSTGKWPSGMDGGDTQVPVLRLYRHDRQRASLEIGAKEEPNISISFGQGWCIAGVDDGLLRFICWEGSTGPGAFVYELAHNDQISFGSQVARMIVPLDTLMSRDDENSLSGLLKSELADIVNFGPVDLDSLSNFEPSESDDLDPIISAALANISSRSFREHVLRTSPPQSPRRGVATYTHQERWKRLLGMCSSWRQLEMAQAVDGLEFAKQTPHLSLRTTPSTASIISMRSLTIASGKTSPFSVVLSWLSDRDDYFSAVSLALDLLQDRSTLIDLWTAFYKVEQDDEESELLGLMDGITSVADTQRTKQSQLTLLADMTIACFIKGGYAMSSTLEAFLARNTLYDPAKASLMLSATAAGCLSDDVDTANTAMGKEYSQIRAKKEIKALLWPVRSLMALAGSRNYLEPVILLLNATIPDELRHRQRSGSKAESLPSLELCEALVSLIASTTDEAANMLLGLIDEQSRQPYWQSLDHETRLVLALLRIHGRHPLLSTSAIRTWLLDQLQQAVQAQVHDETTTVLTSGWLRRLCEACLVNGGCSVDLLVMNAGRASTQHPVDLPQHPPGLAEYCQKLETAHIALRAASRTNSRDLDDTFALDYTVAISTALILEARQEPWYHDTTASSHSQDRTSTRLLLHALCRMAGGPEAGPEHFALDGARLQQQCYMLQDVPAAAHLVSGVPGITLLCCHALLVLRGWQMDHAERFVTAVGIFPTKKEMESRSSRKVVFPWTNQEDDAANSDLINNCQLECWYHVLILLQAHVLSVRAFGDFTASRRRGHVDPVLAARLCLRTWWALTCECLDVATPWLIAWLQRPLLRDNEPAAAPRRLAAAALVQVLIWPHDGSNGNMNAATKGKTSAKASLMGQALKMPETAIIELAQAACGLVEAVPAPSRDDAPPDKAAKALHAPMSVTSSI